MAYKRKTDPDIRCPLEYGLELFGGKWDSRVICVLARCGTLRYSELRDQMVDVTDAVLASTLKKLVGHGIVARKQFDTMPIRVDYSLTDTGRTVVPLLQRICAWSGEFSRSDQKAPTLPCCAKCDFSKRRAG